MRQPLSLALALLALGFAVVSACGGGPIPGIGDGGAETNGDGGRGSSDGGRGDGGDRDGGGKRSDGGRDASVEKDSGAGCPPPNADVCGQPCTTPGLHCPQAVPGVQCVTEPDGDTIWLCVSGTESAATE